MTDEKQKAVKTPSTAAMYQYLGRVTLDWTVVVNRLKILIRRMEDEEGIDKAKRTKFGLFDKEGARIKEGVTDGKPLVKRFECCCEKYLGLPCEDCRQGCVCRRHGRRLGEPYKTRNHSDFIRLLFAAVDARNALMHDMGEEAEKEVLEKRREHWAAGNHKPLETDEYGYDSIVVATLWDIIRKNETNIIKAREMSLHFKRWMELDYYVKVSWGD